MRSNDEPRSRRFGALLAAVILALAAGGIAATRPLLTDAYRTLRRENDSYVLPSPRLTVALSLGYRAALADLIFAHVLVSQGLHFQEKRRFEFVVDYLDTIVALDPKFREPYRLADTLIVLQPARPRQEDYRAARNLIERGLRQFPYDGELWLIAGQYLAYLAAPQVPEAERESWRLEGAKKLARSCELVGSNENIPYHCITAARLFDQAGSRGAMQNFLERILSVSDDPEIQALAGGYLGRSLGASERDRVEERNRRLRALWSRDLRFVSFETLLLLGPGFDPARCAGTARDDVNCATSFRTWGEREASN